MGTLEIQPYTYHYQIIGPDPKDGLHHATLTLSDEDTDLFTITVSQKGFWRTTSRAISAASEALQALDTGRQLLPHMGDFHIQYFSPTST